jgi:hypothetical protein
MSSKGKVTIVMWLAYGAGTVATAFKDADSAMALGIFGALILAIATVRLFRGE